MKQKLNLWKPLSFAAALACSTGSLFADDDKVHGGKDGKPGKDLPAHAELLSALKAVVANGTNGGIGLNMWATLVNRDGVVVAVAFSGEERGDQWPGSRVISAQKA